MATTEERTRSRLDTGLWALAWGLAALVLFLSFGPPPPGASAFPGADKVFHLVFYTSTVTAFLFAAVWRPGRDQERPRALAFVIVLLAIAAGAAIEVLQETVFGRQGEWLDLLADVAGSAISYLVWARTRRRAAVPG